MSNFRPIRASPPRWNDPARSGRDINPLQDSRSSFVAPELARLLPHEIEFIDTVIERAPTTATTFLTVLKVYNDLLQERGLDPQSEVVYFGKLLKLGTVKGKNWKEKWSIVKSHHGYRADSLPSVPSQTRPPPVLSTKSLQSIPRFRRPDPETDTFTLDSQLDDTELAPATHAESDIDDPQYHATPRPIYRRSISPERSVATSSNSLGLDLGLPASHPSLPTFPHQPKRPFNDKWDAQSSETEFAPTQVSTPPSYGAALRDVQPHPTSHVNFRTRYNAKGPLHDVKPAIVTPRAPVKERKGSVINEDEAWNKVKMLRDEADADRFRNEKLVERCWDVWRQGCEWVVMTNEQIAAARDMLMLRITLQRWRARTAARREYTDRIIAISDKRCLKSMMSIWKAKLQAKRQSQWRDAMRLKMKMVRTKREAKLKKDAWAKWRQSYQSHLSAQHYSERLVLRFFEKWNRKLAEVDHLEAVADEYDHVREKRGLVRFWNTWRKASELRTAEKVMVERVDLRIMNDVISVWKRQIRDTAVANDFYDQIIKRKTIRFWKRAIERIRVREHRADRHLDRKDEILVYAFMRIWKARERGKLLERVKTVRLLKDAWAVWKRGIKEQRDRQNLAVAFSMRPKATTATTSLQVWQRAYVTHQNAASFAIHYHSTQLSSRILFAWRLRLREKLKLAKQARIAERFLLMRRSWKSWKVRMEDAKLEKKLKLWENAKLKLVFERWYHIAYRQNLHRWAEQTMRQRIALRILSSTLTHWTNRVADFKFRELETMQRYEQKLMLRSMKKWKAICIRHVEELNLMQSYQDIKREENIRKMFSKWLNSARTARHRRMTLQLKEEEMKRARVNIAWETWRERFLSIKLQPTVDNFIIQRQQSLVFYAFGVWRSKTRSLPAVRFNASHTKEKLWKVWRNAMPRALQRKQARDIDRQSVLSKAFDKWLKTYRTKMALKAIARARYLRLPTTAPRQTVQHSRLVPASSTIAFSRRTTESSIPDPDADGASDAGASRSSPFQKPVPRRSGIASLLLTSKSVSPDNIRSRPKFSSRGSTREPSPAPSRSSFGAAKRDRSPTKSYSRPPSSAGGEGGKSKLWQELREAQRRSRPSTERSPSPS